MTPTLSKIAAAVAPLKVMAHARATIEALRIVRKVAAKLEAAGWDREIAAPYPRNFDRAKLSRAKLVGSLTATASGTHRPGTPCIVTMNLAGISRFIQAAQDNAAAQFDSYVAKLDRKVGTVTEAKLTGANIWGHSMLRVVTEAGEAQNWKTQMILNVSKLGTLFNQFPTRKVKG